MTRKRSALEFNSLRCKANCCNRFVNSLPEGVVVASLLLLSSVAAASMAPLPRLWTLELHDMELSLVREMVSTLVKRDSAWDRIFWWRRAATTSRDDESSCRLSTPEDDEEHPFKSYLLVLKAIFWFVAVASASESRGGKIDHKNGESCTFPQSCFDQDRWGPCNPSFDCCVV